MYHIILYYIVLYYTILYYIIILYYITLYSILLYYITFYSIILYYIIFYYIIYYILFYYIILHSILFYYIILYYYIYIYIHPFSDNTSKKNTNYSVSNDSLCLMVKYHISPSFHICCFWFISQDPLFGFMWTLSHSHFTEAGPQKMPISSCFAPADCLWCPYTATDRLRWECPSPWLHHGVAEPMELFGCRFRKKRFRYSWDRRLLSKWQPSGNAGIYKDIQIQPQQMQLAKKQYQHSIRKTRSSLSKLPG